MSNNFKLALEADSLEDSRNESELEKLREELKRKNATIEEKSKIIASLRDQVSDLEHEAGELDNGSQVMRQKVDRLEKELQEKNQEIEAISRALKEVEMANENLTKRYDARLGQVEKFMKDLAATKKNLGELEIVNEELKSKNEALSIELENSKRSLRGRERDVIPRDETLVQEIRDLTKEIKYLSSQQAQFTTKLESNIQLSQKPVNLTPVAVSSPLPPPLPPRDQNHENEPVTSAIHFSIADEVGEFMNRKTVEQHHCQNHKLQKPQYVSDPVAEQQLRIARANELARRNMQMKPLHQTSYPLELETFGTTNLTETDIKRGHVHKRALNDSSNLQAVHVQRKPIKKAEAFIV